MKYAFLIKLRWMNPNENSHRRFLKSFKFFPLIFFVRWIWKYLVGVHFILVDFIAFGFFSLHDSVNKNLKKNHFIRRGKHSFCHQMISINK